MTINEMVNRYIQYLSKNKGPRYNAGSAEPILPFLLADIAYQEHNMYVSTANLKQRMKEMDNTWRAAYRQFNMSFFCAFKREEWEDITDLMDSLQQAVANDIVIVRSKIMQVMKDVPFEDEKLVSSLLVCHIFAQYAQRAWGDVYKSEVISITGRHKRPNANKQLDIIKDVSFRMAREHFARLSDGVIMLSDLDADGTFYVIAKHIYDWIKKNDTNRNEQDNTDRG